MATLLPQPEGNYSCHYSLDKADSVTLIVGPEKHELLVHADILTRKSKFFQTALKKEWREGQTRTITMPDDEPEIIAGYLRFLYRGRLPIRFEVPQTIHTSFSYKSYSKLYVLGGRLMDATLKRDAFVKMRGLFRCWKWTSPEDNEGLSGHELVNTIYNGTMESDPARRLLVDMHVECPGDLNSQYHPEFLLALAQDFSKRVGSAPLPGNKVLDIDSYLS